ncbi:MAG: flagellar hook-length control protein FliK [Syntrophorhabdaceae bacterium]|nr:flagellar hook-length control protein FliK [Syntrophorhabdaceae bacterium]
MLPLITPLIPPSPDLPTGGVARIENAVAFRSSSWEGLKLRIGDLVKADILSLSADGSVSIRITRESGESATLLARSQVPFEAGESVLLKVTSGGDGEIRLRFVGMADGGGGEKAGSADGAMASSPALSRMLLTDVRQLQAIFRAFPESVKASIPGFSMLEEGTSVEGLTGQALKNAVEGSGVLLETKLKLQPDAVAAGADQKDALLRVGAAMRDTVKSAEVRGVGISSGETAVKTEGMLSSIETYQVFSSANGVLYAPLTLEWDELLDGEILFRKKNRGGRESFTCEMNLDLDPLGKMSISVTMYEGAFLVSLSPENDTTRSLMATQSDDIGRRFREAGLQLRAVAVQQKRNVSFGVPSADGVDLKV